MSRILAISILNVCLVASLCSAQPGPATANQPATAAAGDAGVSVAVLDFEASVSGNPHFGSQIADILTARLSVEESLDLVERTALGKVLEEQKLTLVGLVDQNQAAQVGKLVGAKLLVMGKAFVLDRKLMIVSKVVGVETGRVVGGLRQVEQDKPLSETALLLAEDLAALIRKNAAKLLPREVSLPDPVAEIRKALGDLPRLSVAVVIPEEHIRRREPVPVVDPAVETEVKKVLIDCGYTVVDPGKNDLADWARETMKGQKPAWPAALEKADVLVVGEGFSEFALRTGDLVTCTARAEINLIDRKTGQVLLSDRETCRAVDLSDATAGKTALQAAGRKLGIAIARSLVEHCRKSKPVATQPTEHSSVQPSAPALALPRHLAMLLMTQTPSTAPAKLPTTAAASRPRPKRVIFAAEFGNETGSENHDPMATAMGDLIGVMLAEQPEIVVVERQRLVALTEEQARSLKGLTGKEYAVQAGKLFEADTVLVGRVYLVQQQVMVSAQAVEIATARILASEQIVCQPLSLPETALEMAKRLGQKMSLPLPKIDMKQIDKSPIASLHFAKGLSRYHSGNMDAAIMHFMMAIDLDPDYVEAHYWSGMAYSRQQEDTHAIIEWEEFLRRRPDSKYAPALKKLLAEAKEREKHSTVERLIPETQPAAKGTPGEGENK
ncbi:MAG TPA: hypothetical protein DCX07_02080 [Phycisphaerales bacterium]|nr:hypothetical protein [Phycisphaerales bacterium]